MMKEEVEAKADDSDYYTPEDPHINILSPVKSPSGSTEKVSCVDKVERYKVKVTPNDRFNRKTS